MQAKLCLKGTAMQQQTKVPVPSDVPEISAVDEPSYSSILAEHDVNKSQREARQKLLRDMEDSDGKGGRQEKAVVAHIARDALTSADVPVLGNVLRQIGDVKTLDLILHSPGGEGTCVEKIVSLCRAQCDHFRVIIPNEAKSAATMIALGADEIIMGPCSELGPIDAQIAVVVDGVFRYISAQSFIDAKESLLNQYEDAKAKGRDTQPILQMVASLDIPFIEECKRMMDFGRDVVRKLLLANMFHTAKDKQKRADKVVTALSSVQLFKVHGRLIDGNTARRELKLKVRLLGKQEEFWKKVWEYYTRAEMALNNLPATKMFETRHEFLIAKSK
jgi:ATP-dependent protease ClpP protease subunit